MAALSSLRSRRFSEQQAETLRQYVAFRLRAAWFVLPLTTIDRVLPLESKAIPQITFEGKSIRSINLGRLLFGKDPVKPATPLILGGSPVSSQPSLLIIRDLNGAMASLPCNSQPALLRLAPTKFIALPPTLAQRWHSGSLTGLVTGMAPSTSERPALFEIDPDRFVSIASS